MSLAKWHRQDFGYKVTDRMADTLEDALMEGAYEEETGLLQVYNPHWCELTLGTIDEQAVAYFAYGACALLALELHRITGLPLVTFTQSDGTFAHAAVRLPDGDYLDIDGVCGMDIIMHRYNTELVVTAHDNETSYLEVTGSDFDAFFSFELAAAHEFAHTVLRLHKPLAAV